MAGNATQVIAWLAIGALLTKQMQEEKWGLTTGNRFPQDHSALTCLEAGLESQSDSLVSVSVQVHAETTCPSRREGSPIGRLCRHLEQSRLLPHSRQRLPAHALFTHPPPARRSGL